MRYRFDEVRAALREDWGLSLHRGGDMPFDDRDGRFDTAYSKTGYIVGGHIPGKGHGYWRYATLADVVRACDLDREIQKQRGGRP